MEKLLAGTKYVKRPLYPKTLITLDEDLPATDNGITQINDYDFLLA